MQTMAAQQQQLLGGRVLAAGDTAIASIGTLPASRCRVRTHRSGWAHGTAISKAIVPLRSLARTTAQACGVNRCSLFAWCEGFLMPVMSQFASGERREHLWRAFLRLGPYRLDDVPAFSRAIMEGRPVVVRDGRDGHELPPQWAETFGAASGLVLPLMRDSALVGVAVLDNGLSDISREQKRRMRQLAPYLASVIDSALSVSELRANPPVVDSTFTASRPRGGTPELQETVRRVTQLYARAAEVAIYAERVRVDNLLHDTMRQTLFSIGFRIEAALRGPQRVSTLRKFIRGFKQDVALMMMQINQVIPTGNSPAHAPWAEMAELEAQMGIRVCEALERLPNMTAKDAEEEEAS